MKNNTIIFGDSYSTFEGFIPDGYDTYYSAVDLDGTGVTEVSQTWWHQVITEANLNLVLNDSWSGSTIGYIGYDGVDFSETSSFLHRLRKLIAGGFFAENEIHKVFVFGGTNDSWSDAPLGEEKYGDWENRDFYSALPAICYFLYLLKQTLPTADIYCLINTEIKQEIVSCMQTACKTYGITPVTFDTIDKNADHPTVQGMIAIKNGVLKAIAEKAAV